VQQEKGDDMEASGFGILLAALLSNAASNSAVSHTTTGPTMTEESDIIDTAMAAGSFDTLVAALQAADLVNILKGNGPFTVFAPNDEAFNTLPVGSLELLLHSENKEKLRNVLTCHVVAGVVTAEYAMKLSSAQTLNGQRVAISNHDGTVMVNNAKVVQADIPASNGVIHVIDSVILPNSN
jgi:uncharacterized surface protein with fasciclin (FAS1) repeats